MATQIDGFDNNLPKYNYSPPPLRQKPTERKEGEQSKPIVDDWEKEYQTAIDRERKISGQMNPDYYVDALKRIYELEKESQASKKEIKNLTWYIDILFVVVVILWICVILK